MGIIWVAVWFVLCLLFLSYIWIHLWVASQAPPTAKWAPHLALAISSHCHPPLRNPEPIAPVLHLPLQPLTPSVSSGNASASGAHSLLSLTSQCHWPMLIWNAYSLSSMSPGLQGLTGHTLQASSSSTHSVTLTTFPTQNTALWPYWSLSCSFPAAPAPIQAPLLPTTSSAYEPGISSMVNP